MEIIFGLTVIDDLIDYLVDLLDKYDDDINIDYEKHYDLDNVRKITIEFSVDVDDAKSLIIIKDKLLVTRDYLNSVTKVDWNFVLDN